MTSMDTDKAAEAFGTLAGWMECYVCHQLVEPWVGVRPAIHPTCYLVVGYLGEPGYGNGLHFLHKALNAFLNE